MFIAFLQQCFAVNADHFRSIVDANEVCVIEVQFRVLQYLIHHFAQFIGNHERVGHSFGRHELECALMPVDHHKLEWMLRAVVYSSCVLPVQQLDDMINVAAVFLFQPHPESKYIQTGVAVEVQRLEFGWLTRYCQNLIFDAVVVYNESRQIFLNEEGS